MNRYFVLLVAAVLSFSGLAWGDSCDALEKAKAAASALSKERPLAASRVTGWLSEVSRARAGCSDKAAVLRFVSDPAVKGLLNAQVAAPGSGQAKPSRAANGGAGGASKESASAGRGGGSPVGIWAEGTSAERLAAARATAQFFVESAVQTAGTVALCQPDLKKQTLAAVRTYMELALKANAGGTALEELADTLLVLGKPLRGVPPEELGPILEAANKLTHIQLSRLDESALPEKIRFILAEPPSPNRTLQLMEALLEQARSQSAQKVDTTRLANLADTANALQEIEAKTQGNAVRTLLIDTESLPNESSPGCLLRQKVRESAAARITRAAHLPQIKQARRDCPGEGCDVELKFAMAPCSAGASPSGAAPSGAQCLRLDLAISGTQRVGTPSVAVLPCVEAGRVNDLIDGGLRELRAVLRVSDAWFKGDALVRKDSLRVTQRLERSALPQEFLGRGIYLMQPGPESDLPGLDQALENSFEEIRYRRTGFAAMQPRLGIPRLSWKKENEQLAVQLDYPTPGGLVKPLYSVVLETDNWSSVTPTAAAQRITSAIIRYYESQGSSLDDCRPASRDRWYSLLLAGLPMLMDCDPKNNGRGAALLVVDSAGLLLSAGLGLAAMAARTDYSNHPAHQGSLEASRWLIGGAGVALVPVIGSRIIAVSWYP